MASEHAERAIERLVESSSDLRSCALVGVSGEVLAASEPGEWSAVADELWAAAGGGGGAAVTQVHVATDSGEVFTVRSAAATAIAVADRFALASLMFCDLRAALRELGGG